MQSWWLCWIGWFCLESFTRTLSKKSMSRTVGWCFLADKSPQHRFYRLWRLDMSFLYLLPVGVLMRMFLCKNLKLAPAQWWGSVHPPSILLDNELDFMSGWQPTGPPDDRPSDDRPGNLWEIWGSFYHHPWPSYRRHVPHYVWNDCSSGDIQPPGKLISIL